MSSAVIVDIVRTAVGRGKPGGALSGVHPVTLLAEPLRALAERNNLDPVLIDDVIAGCVGQAGDQGTNVARLAALAAGYPVSVPGTTVDRQCGSSQQAVHFAGQGVIAGSYDIAVACGVESMSRVPMGMNTAGGDPLAALTERFPEGLVGQGISAELICARWNLSRAELDEFSARSHELAARAQADGLFDAEIVPVRVGDASGSVLHTQDETIRANTTVEGLASLKPAFYDADLERRFHEIEWKITPGNSSPLTDGASAALIMSEQKANDLGFKTRARIHTMTVTGSDPLLMLTGVIEATTKVLDRAGLSIGDIDAYEVNEAFAPVPLIWAHEIGADIEKLNPRGGAIALGHALGSSGTRLLCTLVNHLEATGGRYGLQTMCEGGGMANATIIELS